MDGERWGSMKTWKEGDGEMDGEWMERWRDGWSLDGKMESV